MASYESLGVKRVVNAAGNNSRLGSCIMSPEVIAAMTEAARWYVDMEQLKMRAGEAIARITDAEAALVTSGAAGALLLATAACITRDDRAMMWRLPELPEPKEVIVQLGHLIPYHQAMRTAGATLVTVGMPFRTLPEEIEAAISERTVAIAHTFHYRVSQQGMVPLETVIAIAKKYDLPTIVDAALQSYPVGKLSQFTDMGADLVAFSGPKHIGGPPGTGFICGRKQLIEACRLQAGPGFGIGRPMKVSKEEIIGLVTALEIYVKADHEAELRRWESKVDFLVNQLTELPHTRATRVFPDPVGRPVPRVRFWVDEEALGITPDELVQRLRQAEPPVRVLENRFDKSVLFLNPVALLDGDEELIVETFKEIWRTLC